MAERPDPPPHHRKTHDRAAVLPLLGVLLLLPPFAGVFQLDIRIAGVPLTVAYVFAVWALLIAGAVAISRRLRDDLDAPGSPGPAEADD